MSQVKKKNPYIFTVQVFLEDHKIWRNLPVDLAFNI